MGCKSCGELMLKFKDSIKAARDTAAKRMEICKSCEYFEPNLSRCKQCSCFMQIKTKILGATCPEKKW